MYYLFLLFFLLEIFEENVFKTLTDSIERMRNAISN